MQMHKLSLILLFLIALTLLLKTLLCEAQNSPQDFLNAHNAIRRQVGVGPMTWDLDVEAFAEYYVNQQIGDCNFVTTINNSDYSGLLAKGNVYFSGIQAVELWARGKLYYNYYSNSCVGGDCTGYPQIVWRDSVRLGCARARCYNGYWFVACFYAPPGNIPGEHPY